MKRRTKKQAKKPYVIPNQWNNCMVDVMLNRTDFVDLSQLSVTAGILCQLLDKFYGLYYDKHPEVTGQVIALLCSIKTTESLLKKFADDNAPPKRRRRRR